jgi:dihydrodipicolinate reductase
VTSRIGIIGATGRMGFELLKALHATDGATLGAAIARDAHPALGKDAAALACHPQASPSPATSLPRWPHSMSRSTSRMRQP